MMETIERHITSPKGSFFLFGPRGTGKTTWLHAAFPKATWVNLLDAETFRIFSARPERLRELVGPLAGQHVIVDEVQRIPELLPVIHDLIESQGGKNVFVLTGSSARKLRRTGADMLAGRAVVLQMHPFTAAELGNRFDLNTALKIGMVPVCVGASDPLATIRSYVAVYIQEEVRQESLVRNIGDFNRFLEVASFSHGAELNASNIARECAIGRRGVEGYIGILDDLLVAFKVPPFTKRAERAPGGHSKFYFFDAGVYRSLRPSGPLDKPEEIDGPALEGLVAQHLRAWISHNDHADKLYYWRNYSGSEVDFVVYGGRSFAAIEVKNSVRIRSEDLKGLKSFLGLYPKAAGLVLYRGSERLMVDKIMCEPVTSFLPRLRPKAKTVLEKY